MLSRGGFTRTKFFIPKVLFLVSVKDILFIQDHVFKHCSQDMDGCGRACKSEKTSCLQRFVIEALSFSLPSFDADLIPPLGCYTSKEDFQCSVSSIKW